MNNHRRISHLRGHRHGLSSQVLLAYNHHLQRREKNQSIHRLNIHSRSANHQHFVSHLRFTDAIRAAVQHCFRLAAVHIHASFPTRDASETPSPSERNDTTPLSGGSLDSTLSSKQTASIYKRSDSRVFGAVPTGQSGSNGCRGDFGVGGVSGSRGSVKLPRQLARLLKPVQSAGDSSFENINRVTKVREVSRTRARSSLMMTDD